MASGIVSAPPRLATSRVQSLDLLRGLVMIVMALDHVRDFFHAESQMFSPEDLAHTTGIFFFTRWITHFCAPVFMFLAGASVYLSQSRGKPAADVSRFLVTRGLWLILLEVTVLLFGFMFNFSYRLLFLQVIWAFGWCMIALAALIHLPWRALLAASLMVIGLHNLLDGVRPEQFGGFAWLWNVLHVGPAIVPVTTRTQAVVLYPLIPWIAVMAAGYCFGRVMDLDAQPRRRLLIRLGLGLCAAFFVLRLANVYGDPRPWVAGATPTLTVISFFNCSKYPPSLLYLLMTLGPAILLLGIADGVRVSNNHPLQVFGRVPLFYYLLHFYVIHAAAVVFAWFRYGTGAVVLDMPPSALGPLSPYPRGYGYSLAATYLIWGAIVAGLYWPCRWYAGVKYRGNSRWFSYL